MKIIIYILLLSYTQITTAAIDQRQTELLREDFISTISPYLRQAFPELKRDIRVFIDWKDKQSLAYIGSQGVTVAGGLLNLPYMTADALNLILCHEVGHAKRTGDFLIKPMKYGGAELRGDYFAAAFCLPKLLKGSQEIANLPEPLVTRCGGREVCLRTLMAGATTVEFLYREHFTGHYKRSNLPAPDYSRKWVNKADFLQCRLENFINATFGETPLLCRDIQ